MPATRVIYPLVDLLNACVRLYDSGRTMAFEITAFTGPSPALSEVVRFIGNPTWCIITPWGFRSDESDERYMDHWHTMRLSFFRRATPFRDAIVFNRSCHAPAFIILERDRDCVLELARQFDQPGVVTGDARDVGLLDAAGGGFYPCSIRAIGSDR
jgi:hypothetical protein